MHADPAGEWLLRLICGIVGAVIFGTLAYVVCRIVNAVFPNALSGKAIAGITAAFAMLGGAIGAILGPKFLIKYSPKLVQAINKIEKTKFSIKPMKNLQAQSIFGISISDTLFIMLHMPHPQNNEWYFHLQVEVKIVKRQWKIAQIPIYHVTKGQWLTK